MKNSKMARLLVCLFLVSFLPPGKKKIKVWLIGDSTMSIKQTETYPETGWGMPFVHFFDSTVSIYNRAKNGRSTKTFITEQLWKPVAENMQEGDYLFIQFGHNDEVKTKKSYSTEDEFRSNLLTFVTAAKRKSEVPVLITPVARRNFDSASGKIVGTHEVYARIVRSVAAETEVPLIDLDITSQALLQQVGAETSKLFYNQLEPGEHPNYPKGIKDNTHFSELGARKIAQLVLADIRKLKLELAERIVKKEVK